VVAELDRTAVLDFAIGRIEVIKGSPELYVDDSLSKSLLYDRSGDLKVALMISNPRFPLVARQRATMSLLAMEQLGQDLGSIVVKSCAQGMWEGRSFVVWPAYRSLSSHRVFHALQKRFISGQVFDWLREATGATARLADAAAIESTYRSPLTSMAGDDGINPDIRMAAQSGLARLSSGTWRPVTVLSHNDLWIGNVMLPLKRHDRQKRSYGFYLIDWAGVAPQGYPFVDLLRFAKSIGVPRMKVRAEVARHCGVLNCSTAEVLSYVLAGLAAIGYRSDQFPASRFRVLCEGTYAQCMALLPA
jgi:hypothetical protein